jgi:integrase
MSRIRLNYVQAWVDKEGRAHHYFRRPGFPRVRLPGLPGSTEFMHAYQGALGSAPEPIGAARRSRQGSLSAAIADYYGSQAFRSLSGGTPAKRRAILERFREKHGDKPIGLLPKEFVVALIDTMPPHQARNWLKTFRHFIRWAVERKLIKQDPSWGMKVRVPKSDGHHTWTPEEVAAYEAHHPIGSKARLALALGIYTAQRRGDVVRMGPQHIRDGVLSVRQQKTGAALAIPIHPELRIILDATPAGHLTLLVTKSGKSYGANDFSEQFRKWCDDAGLPPECTFHGLRKAALTRLAEAGCTAHQIAAISGHKTLKEVARYTAAVEQAKLAREAMARAVGKTVTSGRQVAQK